MFAVLQLGVSAVSYACECSGSGDPDEYDAVFIGEVVEPRSGGCSGESPEGTPFEVTDATRGVELGEIVYVENQWEPCYIFKVGEVWRIYANEVDETLQTDICSATKQ